MVCLLPLCACANQRRPRAARVDDAAFVTVSSGEWGPHRVRVECAGCDSFVRWNPIDRPPEEEAFRTLGRRPKQPVDWLSTHDDYPPVNERYMAAAAARALVGARG